MLIPDLLTDILQTMRLEHTILCRCQLNAPWGIRFPADDGEAAFHVVTRGQCWLQVEHQPALLLATGDFVMFPHGQEHIISDTLSSPVTDFIDTAIMRPNHGYNSISFGGNGLGIELLAGCFTVRGDRRNPLLSSLPKLIHVRSDHGQFVPWLETTLRYITAELAVSQLGFQTVIARLVDVLFIQAVRAYIDRIDDDQHNWLRALTDPEMVIALSLMQRSPEKSWTVADLAEQIPMSRSAFSARFTELVGQPPMQYLTTWRMIKATELLRESQLGLKDISNKVGYESEVSFSKAFKRWSGVAPSLYRQDYIKNLRATWD
jgi:AraC family transcriptional regulator, alkane utilization regulator